MCLEVRVSAGAPSHSSRGAEMWALPPPQCLVCSPFSRAAGCVAPGKPWNLPGLHFFP